MPYYLIIFGFIFLFAHILRALGRKLRLPFISILIGVGYVLGPSVLGFLSPLSSFYESLISNLSLSLIGLIIGGRISVFQPQIFKIIKASVLLLISNIGVIFALATLLMGLPVYISLIIACLGSFPAPTHTVAIIEETKVDSRFSKTLLSTVIFMELFLVLFFPLVLGFSGLGSSKTIFFDLSKTLGMIIFLSSLGGFIGYILLRIAKFTSTQEILILEVVGAISIIAGVSMYLDFMPIIPSLAAGIILHLRMEENEKPIVLAKELEWLALVPFFILAGVKIELIWIQELGLVGLLFILSRILGRMLPSFVARYYNKLTLVESTWFGASLLPMGGLAIGVTLYTASVLPDQKEFLLQLIFGAVVFFEITSTPLIKQALLKNKD